MFNREEAKKYYRFVQRLHERSVYKKDTENFESLYDSFVRVTKTRSSIYDFISYFSQAEKDQTIAFMKGGCGYFASMLDLLFGEESSGYLIFTIGNKDREMTPNNLKYDYKNEYEKFDIIGEECGFSHILYQHEGKYYDACGEYDSIEDVLKHVTSYYQDYFEKYKEFLTGENYFTEFKNKDLWTLDKKDLFKKKGRVHYILSEHTSNLFNDILEMFEMMKYNFGRNSNREVVFKHNAFVRQ